ncbi:ABC transporter permease [Tundrisphaera sp. TA3]|uniref:ABC transporter permease n=1 Tax=Tundrisphaera sp. TA3 TaxID=3435775 RepID=UPI003EBC5B79
MIARPLLALVAKDLRVFAADRNALVLSFLAPIALASFMAAIFGGAGKSQSSPIPILVADEDRGVISRAIVAGVLADGQVAAVAAGRDAALASVRRGESSLAVVIPAGFGAAAARTLAGGESPPELLLVHDPARRGDAALVRGVLARVVLDAVASGDLGGRGPFGLAPRAAGPPFEVRDASIVPGGADGERAALATHAFAGMVVQFVLFSAIEWGVGLLLERERGLWKRLRTAPVGRATLLAGKVLGCLVASLAIVGAVFGFGALAFGLRPRGGLAGFLLVAVGFAWMAANFGLMVAAFGRSPRGARSISILAVLVMVMLGGGWIPGFLFPAWLLRLTPAIPTRWAIDGFYGSLARGLTAAEVAPAAAALVGFGAAFGALALAAFRRSEPA